MKIEIEMIGSKIAHLRFKNREVMCRTMLRFQEFYESPEFAGKPFSLREFRRWYTTQNNGVFTYYVDWAGFNFPGELTIPFRKGAFNPLSRAEKAVLSALKGIKRPFYVIATEIDEENEGHSALRHELGHAFYHVNEKYRETVDKILSKLQGTDYPKEKIRQLGYRREVLQDELHAFLIDGPEYYLDYFKIKGLFTRPIVAEYKAASIKLNTLLDRALEGKL